MTTAARIRCATSIKTLVGVCDRRGVGVAFDSTGDGVADVAGVGAAERGEGSGARTIEALRSHETNVHTTRMKQIPQPLIVLTTSCAGRRLKDKISDNGCDALGGRRSGRPSTCPAIDPSRDVNILG